VDPHQGRQTARRSLIAGACLGCTSWFGDSEVRGWDVAQLRVRRDSNHQAAKAILANE
jgi:hypothetical protein